MSWPVVRLGDVATFLNGGTPSKSNPAFFEGTIPWITGADIVGPTAGTSRSFITSEAISDSATNLVPGGTVLLVTRTSVGKVAVSDRALCFSQDITAVCQDHQQLHTGYLVHFLRTKQSSFAKAARGATIKGITRDVVASTLVPLPPLEEQRRIAAILDQAEELRAKRRAAIILLDQLPQAIFLEMFGDPFSNPRSWPTKELRSVTSAIIDCPHSTPIWTSDGVTCLRTSNLGKGSWEWTDHRYVSEETYLLRSSRGEIEPGDIILSREGTVGIMAIAPEGHRMCMGQRLVQVKPRVEMVTAQFLMNYLLFLLSPERLKQSMVGSTAQHLNVKELRSLNCLVPPLALQHQFASQIQAIQCAKIAQQSALTELDLLFTSLQATAFGGEL